LPLLVTHFVQTASQEVKEKVDLLEAKHILTLSHKCFLHVVPRQWFFASSSCTPNQPIKSIFTWILSFLHPLVNLRQYFLLSLIIPCTRFFNLLYVLRFKSLLELLASDVFLILANLFKHQFYLALW